MSLAVAITTAAAAARRLGRSSGLGCGRLGGRLGRLGSSSGLGVERADLQTLLVLFQDALVVVLPKGLGGVLAGDALQNLLAARVVVLEAGEVVDVAVNNGVQAVGLVVRGHVGRGKALGHGGCCY